MWHTCARSCFSTGAGRQELNLTEHFSYEEFIRSDKAKAAGISNTPAADLLPALRLTARGLERVRELAGHPLWLLSGYRCEELNKLVGGSRTSQHVKGEAADILCPGLGNPRALAKLIHDNAIEIGYDQLILDRNAHSEWVHISFTEDPRGDALTMTDSGLLIVGIA